MAIYQSSALYRTYLPRSTRLGDGSYTWVNPSGRGSILNTKIGNVRPSLSKSNTKHLSPTFRIRLAEKLKMANLTISDLLPFLSLDIKTIKNVESTIHGIVDAILLSFPEVFDFANPKSRAPIKTVTRLIRQIIKLSGRTGTYEIIISQWKDFTSWVWTQVSRLKGSEASIRPKDNIFTFLAEKISSLRGLLVKGLKTKCDCTKMAHFTSSRQLPAGGPRAEQKSLNTFIQSVTEPFVINEKDIFELYETARSVGEKCLHFCNGELPYGTSHISLSGAGDFDYPCSMGGRSQKIISDCREVLTVEPEEDSVVRLPLGVEVRDVKGIPRWKTWCRTANLVTPEYAVFGEVIRSPDFIYVFDDRRWGFDEALGQQIYSVALIKAKEHGVFLDDGSVNPLIPPIPARVATSNEPGGKSRIVTTTKWWVIVLEQAAGHFIQSVLAFHPSARDGLIRADQAWLYLDALFRVTFTCPEYELLSSDLCEATDHIPHEVIYTMVSGFMRGLQIEGSVPIRVALALVCSERKFTARLRSGGKIEFIKVRGAMMGEPFTKSVLTLLSLCVEEESYLHYKKLYRENFLKRQILDEGVSIEAKQLLLREEALTYLEDPDLSRAYRIGGDDHIAHGPPNYLDRITRNHIRWGSKISMSKHGRSRVVKYCEKVLTLHGADLKVGTALINRSTENYNRSAFVDSIKVRLLSPCSKALDTLDDKNVAIGKARSFGRTLRWLNRDYFPASWQRSVRDRFCWRMQKFLPRTRSIAKHLLLPSEWGGLDLYIDVNELRANWEEYNAASQSLIWRFINGANSYKEKKAAIGMVTTSLRRGHSFTSDLIDALDEVGLVEACELLALPSPIPYTIGACKTKFNMPYGLNMSAQLKFLEGKGVYTLERVVEKVLRSTLFNAMLSNTAQAKRYNTTPWKKRFAVLWDVISSEVPNFEGSTYALPSEEDWVRALNGLNFNQLVVYDINVFEECDLKTSSGLLIGTQSRKFLDILESGLPSLSLPGLAECVAPVSTDQQYVEFLIDSIRRVKLEDSNETPIAGESIVP